MKHLERRDGSKSRLGIAEMSVTYALVFLTCTNLVLSKSVNATVSLDVTTLTPLPSTRGSSLVTSRPVTTDRSNRPGTSSPIPRTSDQESPSPANLAPTVVETKTTIPTVKRKTDSLTTGLPTTPNRPTTGATTRVATTVGAAKVTTTPDNNATSPGVKTPSKTVTPVGYIIQNATGYPAATTEAARPTETGRQTKRSGAGTSSGSVGELTTAPPTVTSIVYETTVIVVMKTVPAGGEETVDYVTLNATTAIGGGSGFNPDHERDELKKLLVIIGASIGAAVVAILIVFVIVYRVAKRRNKKANSRYYNFKKKKSNYEKVLHLQEYYGELDTDTSSAGTGAAWVFQENEQDASKTITLELDSKDRERQASRPSKKRSKNKNKNNRNKGGAGRGNYQVLAEMYPTRNIPPDVLLSADGAVHSNSEDEEDAILDTSFGPVMMQQQSESKPDGLAFSDSFASDSDRSSWPAWNTRPFVTITQGDDAVVEL